MGNTSKYLLLTGATGMVGGELTLTFLRQGWNVIALVRGEVKRLHNRLIKSEQYDSKLLVNLSIINGDLADPPDSWEVFSAGIISMVVHCACDTRFNARASKKHPNILAYHNLRSYIDLCMGDVKFLLYSTAYVNFQNNKYLYENSDCSSDFENGYLHSKRVIEDCLQKDFNDWIIVRPSIILSEGVKSKRFALSMLWVFPLLSKIGWILAKPKAKLDVVSVKLVCDATVLIVDKFENDEIQAEVYHITAGKKSKNLEAIFKMLSPSVDRISSVEFVSSEKRKMELESNFSDNNRRRYKSILYYLPFLSANVTYSNRKLNILMNDLHVKDPKKYVLELIDLFNSKEADRESETP